MTLVNKFRFEHVDDDLNGFLKYLYDKYGKEEYMNKIEVYSTSVRLEYYDTNAIDFNNDTHWTQNDDDEEKSICIKLPCPFLVEGYTLQASNGYYHLKTWYISASNDGQTFTEEHKEEDVDQKLKNGGKATYYHTHAFFEPYQYYKIRYDSIYSNTITRFDLNQIEFFGKIPHNTCNTESKKHIIVSLFFVLEFIFSN